MPPGKVIATLISPPAAFLAAKASLSFGGIELDAGFGIFLGNGNALAVEIEPRDDRHRHGHVVLRNLAGRDQIGHRGQDMRAVNAIRLAAEHEVVAGRPPGRLLQHFDIGEPMLLEEALFLGDDQRCGIGPAHEAEFYTGHFRPGACSECA